MAPYSALALALLPALVAGAAIRGLDPELAPRYAPVDGKFTCLDGFKSVPFSAVNDDYCDCLDGSDEPGMWPRSPATWRRRSAAVAAAGRAVRSVVVTLTHQHPSMPCRNLCLPQRPFLLREQVLPAAALERFNGGRRRVRCAAAAAAACCTCGCCCVRGCCCRRRCRCCCCVAAAAAVAAGRSCMPPLHLVEPSLQRALGIAAAAAAAALPPTGCTAAVRRRLQRITGSARLPRLLWLQTAAMALTSLQGAAPTAAMRRATSR